jgi:hypothetical protein
LEETREVKAEIKVDWDISLLFANDEFVDIITESETPLESAIETLLDKERTLLLAVENPVDVEDAAAETAVDALFDRELLESCSIFEKFRSRRGSNTA